MSSRPANVRGRYRVPGLGCSKQGYNPGLVQNFNSAMKTLKAISVLFFCAQFDDFTL